MRTVVCITLVLSLLSANLAAAAEVQVPMDRAGRVQRVDVSLAQRLQLFKDKPGFQEARLFQLSDSSFVLEISSMLKAGLTRERVPLTLAGADSLRDIVASGLVEHKTTPELDTSGRPLFVATTTLMAVGFYGWAVPFLFEENSADEVVLGTYFVTAAAGTIVPLLYTHNRPVSMGSALMGWYGMSRGTVHGALIPHAFELEPLDKASVGWAASISIAEGIAGFEWASRSGMSAGSAISICTGTDFGLGYGLGFADLADANTAGRAAAGLVGAGAGLAAGALYAPHRDHTYGDASVMRTAGLLGGYTGIALVQTFGATDYENSSTLGAMTGATLGLLVGDRLVRRTDFTFSQGVLMNLSTIGGGLFGLGLGLFASGNDDIKEQALWGMSAVGSVTGYALAYAANAKSARRADADRSSWRFDMVPTPPAHRGGMPGVMMTVRTTLD